MNPSLALADASFVFSHDAATGYIRPNTLSPDGLTWSYTKTQKGGFYQQLQDGARALDLRPKLLYNGTVVFHHGKITIHTISFEDALVEVIQWCQENPTEIVLLLTSHYSFGTAQTYYNTDYDDDGGGYYLTDDDNEANDENDDQSGDKYDSMVSALSRIYSQLGILYLSCQDVYGWTVETIMEQAALSSGGVLLALDGQNSYPGGQCAKSNYIETEMVTCWTNATTSCKTSDVPYRQLKDYVLKSANSPATDSNQQLGPPSNLYRYPLFQIQALWQVSVQSAAIGIAHFSNILADDKESKLHAKLVTLIHSESMPYSISLFTMDNVALHGNAITSVLRNRCGQSILGSSVPCGPDLPAPRLHYVHVEPKAIVTFLLSLYLVALVFFFFRKRPQSLSVIHNSCSRAYRTLMPFHGGSKEESLILQEPRSTII
jgi:hypothetical protein